MVRIRLFASLRDLAGKAEIELQVKGKTTVSELFEMVKLRYPELRRYEPSVLIAVNEEYAHWDTVVRPGDEVAFFPPVSGGGL